MKEINGYVRTGVYHEQHNLKCQDYIYGIQKGSIKVIALADGAGNTNYAHEGAKTAAITVAQYLLEEFDDLYFIDKATLQHQIIVTVRSALYKLCDGFNVGLEDVQSTLLAVAYDEESSRMIRIHLGDGYIIRECEKEKKIVSYPHNGLSRYETYLTSMFPVKEQIKIYRGEFEQHGKIYLLSDGWCELLQEQEDILQYATCEQQYQGRVYDDISIIGMTV